MQLSVSLALGAFAVLHGDNPPYDPAATAYFSRMAAQPGPARKGQINTLIVALKAAGVWAKLDFLYLLAAHDAQAGRLNMVANDELAPVNSPLFTVDRGFKGDGAAAYLESALTQSALPKAGQNDASWLLGVRQIGETSRFVIGAISAVRFAFQGRAAGGVSVRNTQGAVSDDVASVPQTGRFGSTRAGATDHRVFRNGELVGTFATSSSAPSSQAILLFRGGSVYSSAEVTHYGAGASLTPAQQAAADAAIQNYLQAIGA